MILEIDAGNTFIKWRLLDQCKIADHGKFLTASADWRRPNIWSHATEVRVASVAGGAVNQKLSEMILQACGIQPQFAVTAAQCAGVVNSYADPSRMGVDRWLVMLAAFNDCKSACCIVDCGSAITVDYLSGSGAHQGGYIIPGLRLLSSTLLDNTAEVRVDKDIQTFDFSPGRNTSEAVTHGVNYVFNALCQKISEEVKESEEQYALYITGGDGELFCQLAETGEYKPDLVMDGLLWSVT